MVNIKDRKFILIDKTQVGDLIITNGYIPISARTRDAIFIQKIWSPPYYYPKITSLFLRKGFFVGFMGTPHKHKTGDASWIYGHCPAMVKE